MPFDSIRLQFANSSLNLPKHEDFSAAFLTAQEILGVNLKGDTSLRVSGNPDSAPLCAAPLTSHFKETYKEVKDEFNSRSIRATSAAAGLCLT
jgi:hypothetical protein